MLLRVLSVLRLVAASVLSIRPACSLVLSPRHPVFFVFVFFFNDTATTEIYTLSLHDALPISLIQGVQAARPDRLKGQTQGRGISVP